MRNKSSLLLATGVLLLLIVPSIGIAEVDEIDEDVMTAGDTFMYEVTTFDIPWADLLGGGGEMPFPIEDLVLDLSGSTLAVKVMTVDNDGYYMLNSYIILGEDIEIPFPEQDVPSEVTEIFGDALVIPEGVGIGIGAGIPGSDYLDFISDDLEGYSGVPFYWDPDEWDTYEELFDDLEDAMKAEVVVNPPEITVTQDEDENEFRVELDGDAPGGINVNLEVAWHLSGNYAGVFKRVSGQITGDLMSSEEYSSEYAGGMGSGTSEEITLKVEVSFDEKRHNPLPDEILDEETIQIEVDDASLTYEVDGDFDNNDFTDPLDDIEDELDDAIGENIFEFDVRDVEGCYYKTDIELYTGEDAEDVWWNGFTGFPGGQEDPSWYDYDDPWKQWYFSPSIGIVPIGAPGITPDWDMWRASTLSISSVLETFERTVTSNAAEDALDDMGMTIEEFDVTYELRGDKNYKFFYFNASLDFKWSYADAKNKSLYPDIDTPFEILATADFEVYEAYTEEGLLAGIVSNVNIEVEVDDFPAGEEYVGGVYVTNTIDGSFSLDMEVKLRNPDIKSLPDPEDLEEDTKPEGAGGGGITPGFSIIPALIMFAAVAVIIKRRK